MKMVVVMWDVIVMTMRIRGEGMQVSGLIGVRRTATTTRCAGGVWCLWRVARGSRCGWAQVIIIGRGSHQMTISEFVAEISIAGSRNVNGMSSRVKG